jgi:hypothetical protein
LQPRRPARPRPRGPQPTLTPPRRPVLPPRQLLERALGALCREHNATPDNPTLGVVRIHGALHAEERAAFQEIARQLCATFRCTFSRSASYDDNLVFLKEMLQQLRR